MRPTNIFGPAQFPEKFIPLCIANALGSAPIPVYGDGQQRRAWLFVEDVCRALQVVVERGTVGDIYNLGSGSEHANLDTVRQVLSLMKRSSDLIRFVDDRPGHDRRYALNDAKLRALGWRPQTTFEQGLVKTIAWYQEHMAWWQPLAQALREDSYHWLNRSARSGTQPASGAVR